MVFDFFEKICEIPHASGETAALKEWLVAQLRASGAVVRTDSYGNIHALKGSPKVCLQAHYDMVKVGENPRVEVEVVREISGEIGADGGEIGGSKTAANLNLNQTKNNVQILYPSGVNSNLDAGDDKVRENGAKPSGWAAFLRENFAPRGEWDDDACEGVWLRARGSSLGADNGIGVALVLGAFFAHADVEALLTNDEEVGLLGAQGFAGELVAPNLLNLDSECEGEIVVGCAADVRVGFEREPEFADVGAGNGGASGENGAEFGGAGAGNGAEIGGAFWQLTAHGVGGHSGIDIDKGIENAIKTLAHFVRRSGGRLAFFAGGERINSIPANATAVAFLPSDVSGALAAELAARGDFAGAGGGAAGGAAAGENVAEIGENVADFAGAAQPANRGNPNLNLGAGLGFVNSQIRPNWKNPPNSNLTGAAGKIGAASKNGENVAETCEISAKIGANLGENTLENAAELGEKTLEIGAKTSANFGAKTPAQATPRAQFALGELRRGALTARRLEAAFPVERGEILAFLDDFHSGVYERGELGVKTSANLSLAALRGGRFCAEVFARSCDEVALRRLCAGFVARFGGGERGAKTSGHGTGKISPLRASQSKRDNPQNAQTANENLGKNAANSNLDGASAADGCVDFGVDFGGKIPPVARGESGAIGGGFAVTIGEFSPAWKPRKNPFTAQVAAAFAARRVFARVAAIHAGLECGVLVANARRVRGVRINAASIGPNIAAPHSTSERVDVASVIRIGRIVGDILAGARG